MTTIRDSIPTEDIIRAYMDELVEHEEEVTIEQSTEPIMDKISESGIEENRSIENDDDAIIGIKDIDDQEVTTRLKFNDHDSVLDEMDSVGTINAPKKLERLEEISIANALQRKIDEEEEDSEDRIKIHDDGGSFDLGLIDVDNNQIPSNYQSIDQNQELDVSLLDIEELK